MLISYSRHLTAADYPVTKISNYYCFDTATAGRMAKELLDYGVVTNMVNLQKEVILAQSNMIVWQNHVITNTDKEIKSIKREALRARVRACIRVGAVTFFTGAG